MTDHPTTAVPQKHDMPVVIYSNVVYEPAKDLASGYLLKFEDEEAE